VSASAQRRRVIDPWKQIPLRTQDSPAAAGTAKPATDPATASTAESMKNGAKRARWLRPLDRARNIEYAARQTKVAAFVAVIREAGRSGSVATAATSKAAAAAKITVVAAGEIFLCMGLLDSWCCE
jgi:hypothetical protein